MAKVAAVTVIPTKEEATKIALEVERTEAALAQMKAELKAYVEVKDPLEAGDKRWDFYPSYSWSFTPEKLKELALNITIEGQNPWAYLNLSSTAIKKLGWKEDVLTQYGSKEVASRSFKANKA